ncbi:GNAT family N-acetyltransferase [uncultured Actinomyces sp.]|uniref:GNAT family N-acetyltransferase n=1 Tax=uncultured Actinomyces sp. TaxID=249061 RepID=UPI0028044ADF|nr:GNAT family N-acetyltransferase [uncultured Actinomyces sp.]
MPTSTTLPVSMTAIWSAVVIDASGQMLGRLEATVHDGLAEVAFLFGPGHWGHGHAQQGLVWLQAEVSRRCGVHDFWATTVPANQRCQRLLLRCGYAAVTGPVTSCSAVGRPAADRWDADASRTLRWRVHHARPPLRSRRLTSGALA